VTCCLCAGSMRCELAYGLVAPGLWCCAAQALDILKRQCLQVARRRFCKGNLTGGPHQWMTCAAVEQLHDRNPPVMKVPGVLPLWLSVLGLAPPLDERFVCFLDLWPQQKRCGSCNRFIMMSTRAICTRCSAVQAICLLQDCQWLTRVQQKRLDWHLYEAVLRPVVCDVRVGPQHKLAICALDHVLGRPLRHAQQ
jgi:hypothetical protein